MVLRMSPLTFNRMARRSAISSINAYQRYLSPRKGFACPHRVLYQGKSCSEYVKQTLSSQGLLAAIRVAPKRFRACGLAATDLQLKGTKQQGGCIVIPCCIPI